MESHLGDGDVHGQAIQECMLMSQVSQAKKNMLLFSSWSKFSGVKSWIVQNAGNEC